MASPWASVVVDYEPGSAGDYLNATTALGAPERYTGEAESGGLFASAVTVFNPVWGHDEIVTIGEGGSLTLQLGTPANDDPSHLYGVDLIIFGNAGFPTTDYPNGQVAPQASLLGGGYGRVSVSANGVDFVDVPGTLADQLFPTQGYLDVPPFETPAGLSPTDFLKPVNPSLTLSDFNGLSYAEILALYDGSGGGTPIDLSATGLTSITHVRISVDDDMDPTTALTAEIDAIASVPEPATALSILLFGGLLAIRRKRN